MRRFLKGRREVFGQRSVLSLELEEAKEIIAGRSSESGDPMSRR